MTGRQTMTRRLGTILLLDDDESSHFLTSMIIRQKNCADHVHLASSGAKALKYLECVDGIRVTFPDLIIVDLHMPGMGGFDFIARLSKMNRKGAPKPVIVLLTNSPEETHRAGNPGDTIVLAKPLTEGMLSKLLQQNFPDHFKTEMGTPWMTQRTIITTSDLDFFDAYGE